MAANHDGLRDRGRVVITLHFNRILHPASRVLEVLCNLLQVVLAELRKVFDFLDFFQTQLSQRLLLYLHLLGAREEGVGLILGESRPRAHCRFCHEACLLLRWV
eukprot:14871684-Ditylum_brightwellii.AAC.1